MSSNSTSDRDNDLDICGQQPCLDMYTHLCLCYPIPEHGSVYQKIIDRLEFGLNRLGRHFPWVAAQVVNEGANETTTGVFKFKPLQATPRLIVQDLRTSSPMVTWESLTKAQFPFRLFDEALICPRKSLPDGTEGSEKPVFMLQANFIQGGLILTFTSSHQAMDMTGHGQVMRLLDKACRGEEFTEEELEIGNRKRSDLISFLNDEILPPNAFEDVEPKLKNLSSPPSSPPANCSWTYVSFPAAALDELKDEATTDLASGFVSTDDVLTTFLWKSITRARSSRLDTHTEVSLGRAVDPRRYLGVPKTYPGILQGMVYQKTTVGELTTEPLGKTALKLRAQVDPGTCTLGFDTRVFVTKLHRSPRKDNVTVMATFDGSRDVMVSSWAKEKMYTLDLGLGLGTPEYVRRPQFVPVEGLAFLMPRRGNEEIMAAICLGERDLEVLAEDREFLKYGALVL